MQSVSRRFVSTNILAATDEVLRAQEQERNEIASVIYSLVFAY